MCVCYLSGFIVVSWIFPKNPGLPLVCLTLGSSFGQFVVPALFELFIASYTWKGAFILISAIALQCFTFGLIIHDSNAYYVTENDNDKSYTQHVKQRELLSSLCSDILIWILLINYLFLALTGKYVVMSVYLGKTSDRVILHVCLSVCVSVLLSANFAITYHFINTRYKAHI